MSLQPGTRLGPYEILGPLGAGGMGEVYRARDTRLGREVAVKVLPEGLADDPERVARFEREARSASALSHAHTVSVYDVGREDGRLYLVTEIVEGGSLRDALERGPLSVRRVLELAAQVASGLAAAHERGIVHRDLKPENVLLARSGEAKIADFGLAKLTESESGAASQLPTSDGNSTAAGLVMGTVAYMSPEQATGRKVDFRSDQFAFGAILWEMLAGRPCFRRGSSAETLSAVIRDEPEPVRTLNSAVPAPLAWIVERCLEKDPEGRYASTRDLSREIAGVRDHLTDVSGGRVATRGPEARRGGRILPAAALAAGAALLGAAAVLVLRRSPPVAPAVIRFTMPPPPSTRFFSRFDTTGLAVSPDGSRVAFLGDAFGTSRDVGLSPASAHVWVRDLRDLAARSIAGTDGANSLFWSPDGRSIGFFSGATLKRVDVDGGPPTPVCDVAAARKLVGTWGAGEILFSSTFEGVIYRVPVEGGTPVAVIRADRARGETRATWPWFLPDGKSFLYVLVRREGEGRLMLGFVDGRPPKDVGPIASRVEYADPGFVVMARDGALFAQRFDPRAGTLSGPLHPLAASVYYFFTSKWAGFSVSRRGTLAYQPTGNLTRLAWFDRSGRVLQELGSPDAGETISLSLSPDGRSALFDRTRSDLGTFDVWMIDLERGAETRLTSAPNTEFDPIWMPDGRRIVYSVVHDYLPQIVRRDVGGGPEEPVLPVGTFQEGLDVWPDGKRLLFAQTTPQNTWGIWSAPLDTAGAPSPVVVGNAQQEMGRLSPDGRFVAYLSNEAGPSDVYVEEIGQHPAKIRVSTGGAELLRWSRDGREIFYTSDDRGMYAVPVRTSPKLEIGAPTRLFDLPGEGWSAFDVSADGRFLAAVRHLSYTTSPLTVAVDALSEIGR